MKKTLILLAAVCCFVLGMRDGQAAFIGESLDFDLPTEIADAAEAGKRVVVMFHYSGCPFCSKMRARVFPDPAVDAYYSDKFVLLESNIKGDLEITSPDGKGMSEKAWATELRIRATPVIIFFDTDGKQALRITGYFPPERFIAAGRYVHSGAYKEGISLARFMRDGR
ncbi:thioredoxin family protein [Magnetofaba australis]|uniref:Thioredoxin domain-containing protein n=1 Tax=Magnetofaba australis IT-1 TaxID=1434232 RepID=A0A1Y2K3E2_9PROT|nr:thioredoxin family protein [Magnetofaba australis]OSM02531.1 hypothetical protein MAIT1_02688 [Magnetofaba australis IT-1]